MDLPLCGLLDEIIQEDDHSNSVAFIAKKDAEAYTSGKMVTWYSLSIHLIRILYIDPGPFWTVTLPAHLPHSVIV